jgi:oxygen-independent coproporphyrinogen III oxidase
MPRRISEYNERMTGLYVHVPFCEKKCHYCDFVTAADSADARDAFLSALEREASHRADSWRGGEFETLYVGGGTPSLFDGAQTERFFEAVRSRFRFADGAEVTWEANPGDVTPAKAALYRRLGVTRVSVGAQTFDDASLASLNRSHGAAATAATVRALRGAGIDNVSLDLMIALPGQTPERAAESVARALELAPDHVSLYELTVEPRTAFGAMRRAGTLRLPAEDAQLEMLEASRRLLIEAGLEHYELLSFARPGRRSRHNLLYWTGGEYLALGPGAHAFVGGRRSVYARTVERWFSKVAAGDFAPDESEALAPERRDAESLVLALRLAEGAERSRFPLAVARLAGKPRRTASPHRAGEALGGNGFLRAFFAGRVIKSDTGVKP